MQKSIFSVDVEDWFHILDVPSSPTIDKWEELPSHVEKNFLRLLDLFDEKQVNVTCFFLGWVAQRFPHLVKEAQKRGHELASHGFAHKLVYKVDENEFYEDAIKAKQIIEQISGTQVNGYRATGFSITEKTPWFFEKLHKAGYLYDSSVFPAPRGHGGMKTDKYAPYPISFESANLIEFPISVADTFGKPMCFFGGGYLRLAPLFLIKRKAHQVLQEKRPVIFYIHPREIDPLQPRLAMNWKRRFKTYVNLRTTELKIRKILDSFSFCTFREYLENESL